MSEDVTPAQAHAARHEALLLDVREQYEWDAGHAADAVHVPMGELTVDDERLTSGGLVICICRSGNRSGTVARALREHGVDAVNMLGGMQGWAADGLPFVAEGDGPPTVA